MQALSAAAATVLTVQVLRELHADVPAGP